MYSFGRQRARVKRTIFKFKLLFTDRRKVVMKRSRNGLEYM